MCTHAHVCTHAHQHTPVHIMHAHTHNTHTHTHSHTQDPTVATFTINGKMVGSVKLSSTTMKGFVGFGTSGFFAAEFDNFSIE